MWWECPRGGAPVNDLRTPQGDSDRSRPRTRSSERGVVLIWATITVMLIAGLVLAGTDRTAAVDGLADLEWEARGQVYEVARAGITDAYAWLRRQTSQPVTQFRPLRVGIDRPAYLKVPVDGWATEIASVVSADDIINETDDPDVGLTRSFEIADNLWARYTCRSEVPAEPFVDGNGNGRHDDGEVFTDVNANGIRDDVSGCRDTSTGRGSPLAGGVWELSCEAEIFHRARRDLPLETAPNRRLAKVTLVQEVRRLGIRLPAEGALVVDQGNRVHIQNRGRLRAPGGAAIAHASGTGNPLIVRPADVIGGISPIPNYMGSLSDVFGVSFDTLRSMADIAVSDIADLPATIGDGALVTIDGDVVWDDSMPMRGTGVVVVRGNVTYASGSNSFFSGLLFVDGHLEMKAPCYIRGSVIGTGDATVLGTGGDYAEIEWDPDLVNELISRLSRYRLSKAPYRPGMDPLSLNGRAIVEAVGQVSRDWNGWRSTSRVGEVTVAAGQAYEGDGSTPGTDNRGGPGDDVVRGGRYVRDTYFDAEANGNGKGKGKK